MDDYLNNPPNPMTEVAIETATGIVGVKFATGNCSDSCNIPDNSSIVYNYARDGMPISLTALLACDRGP